MAARPLEAPRPLPLFLQPMAAAITGRARPPLFTTGPATRHALAAAGALGATTGTVVHLPSPPRGPAASAVLAHELTHTRSPVRRPRFLLGGGLSSLLDDDERSALAAGARQAASNAGPGLIGRGERAASGLLGPGRQTAGGLLDQGRQALAGVGETAAGIVDQLPVGGGLGAVGDVATRAARAAVIAAAASPAAAATGLANDVESALGSAVDTASGHLDRAGAAAGGLADRATGAVTDAVSGGMSAVAGAAGALDPDKVVEIVEQRLLREIERRGGRWAGMF